MTDERAECAVPRVDGVLEDRGNRRIASRAKRELAHHDAIETVKGGVGIGQQLVEDFGGQVGNPRHIGRK